MATGANRPLDDLYGAPLSAFTALRDRLARELAAAGRQSEAAEIRRLRKPSVPLWTVNQLARRDPAGMGRFIEAVNRLKRAQLQGGADVGQLTASQRTALGAVLDDAPEVMRIAGMKPSPAMLQRLSHTLQGAAADRRLQGELRRGRLREEQQAPGFDVLAGLGRASRPKQQSATVRAAPGPSRQAREAQAAAREARQRQALAVRHRRAADAAMARAERLSRQLRALQDKAAQARSAAEAAERQARQARADGPGRT